MSILTIRLFGEFLAADHRGNPLAIASKKTQALLTWLALHRNTPVPLYDFGALFGVEDVAGMARDLRFAFVLQRLRSTSLASTRSSRAEQSTPFARLPTSTRRT